MLSAPLHPVVMDVAGTSGSEQAREGLGSVCAPEITERAATVSRTWLFSL